MKHKTLVRASWIVALSGCSLLAACSRAPQPGEVFDEARIAGRTVTSFPHAGEDYFHDMDGGAELTPEEIKGRNMWLVWTGGNDRLWNQLTTFTFGAFDLLKVVSSHPSLGFSRANRWSYFGLVNEPCFQGPQGPDPARHGLWLDVRSANCPADPFENEARYPGVKLGSRGQPLGDGTSQPVGSYYGYATGIMGLRLFPNPDFDAHAASQWDPVRYYTDPSYYNRAGLIRPYRVGMACGFCHVGPSPIKPPADPESPAFANLSSTVGAQYMSVDKVFVFNSGQPQAQGNFTYQLLHSWRPGSMDTSLIASDNINNPRTMNALYAVAARAAVSQRLWHEKLSGGSLDNRQLNDFMSSGPLTEFYSKADATVRAPHILKDGADSVGLLGALNRVHMNIGVFSEEWLLHFNAVAGGKTVTPIRIADAQKNSVYWQATETGTPNTALFFLKAARPDRLQDAPGGNQFLAASPATLAHGKEVFADTCARCHSSKSPPPPATLNLNADRCAGAAYLDCFKRYWSWTQTGDYKGQMRRIVAQADFLDGNYLSSDSRIPVTLLRTNLCSPLATNAIKGSVWDNFSSQSYKELPSVGTVTLSNPFNASQVAYTMPAGGRGYTRVPSLISIWSTAPFLLNNSVGPFSPDPSVAARMKVFDESVRQLLWPQRRMRDPVLGSKVPGFIDRTTVRSSLNIPVGFVPEALQPLQGTLHRLLPRLIGGGGDIELGPIPKGMPVGLLGNLKLRAESGDPAVELAYARNAGEVLLKLQYDLLTAGGESDAQLGAKFSNLATPLLALSKCPDFVVNRGHYFGTAEFNDRSGLTSDETAFGVEPVLSDDDKSALIEFMKTF